jgi:hypothetical protein
MSNDVDLGIANRLGGKAGELAGPSSLRGTYATKQSSAETAL